MMKRKSFLTALSAVGIAGLAGAPRALLARARIASIDVRVRGDRQWMHGRPGACAYAADKKLPWGGYTLEQMLS